MPSSGGSSLSALLSKMKKEKVEKEKPEPVKDGTTKSPPLRRK